MKKTNRPKYLKNTYNHERGIHFVMDDPSLLTIFIDGNWETLDRKETLKLQKKLNKIVQYLENYEKRT